jgi:hypothetical protein
VGTQVQTIIAAVRAGIADTPFSIKNDVYLDGDKIGEHMNKHLFGNFGAVK